MSSHLSLLYWSRTCLRRRSAVLPMALPLCNRPEASPVIQAAPGLLRCEHGAMPALLEGGCSAAHSPHCSAQKRCGLLKCCSHLA